MVRLSRIIGILVLLGLLLTCLTFKIFDESSKPEQFKVWNDESQLSVGDFLRYPPIIRGKADATISFRVRIIENPELRAQVELDRFNSFIRKNSISENLIRHEVYHVKLAHFFAKEINQAIQDKKLNFEQAVQIRNNRNQRIYQYQKLYDQETNHSLIKVKQDYWEYKIDSMLSKFENYEIYPESDNIWIFFPQKPKQFVLELDGEFLNGYKLEEYSSKFWIVDLEFKEIDSLNFENYWVYLLFQQGLNDIVVDYNFTHERSILEVYSKDTVEKINVMDKFFKGNNSIYLLRNSYPYGENEKVYKVMSDQFFNSFWLDEK
jgi:hypothetical protein